VIAEAQPAVAAQADMLETIDMAALEACSAITEPPSAKHCNCRRKLWFLRKENLS